MAITSIDELAKYAGGEEVLLPGWKSEETVIFRLRRPSMLLLADSGKIPNSLLSTAAGLFQHGMEKASSADFKSLGEVFRIIAKASLVSPSYDELQEIGLDLTDVQLFYIYKYSQSGVDTLRRFREKQESMAVSGNGKDLRKKAK